MMLYCNPDLNAVWRDVRKQSRAWRSRDKKILELVHKLNAKPDGSLPYCGMDIDPNCTCIITTDMIESKKESSWTKGPCNALLNSLVRYLPSLTVKIRFPNAGKAMAAIDIALNAAQSGSPVLFLDVRERPLVEAADRVAFIKATKAAFEAHCDALLKAGLAESFDACSIGYMYHALVGDGTASTLDMAGEKNGAPSVEKRLALHEAIQLAGDESSGRAQKGAAQGMKRATPEQASELASWLADRYFKDAFEVLVDKAEREAKGETYQTLYKEQIIAMQVWTEALFASPNFHQVVTYAIATRRSAWFGSWFASIGCQRPTRSRSCTYCGRHGASTTCACASPRGTSACQSSSLRCSSSWRGRSFWWPLCAATPPSSRQAPTQAASQTTPPVQVSWSTSSGTHCSP